VSAAVDDAAAPGERRVHEAAGGGHDGDAPEAQGPADPVPRDADAVLAWRSRWRPTRPPRRVEPRRRRSPFRARPRARPRPRHRRARAPSSAATAASSSCARAPSASVCSSASRSRSTVSCRAPTHVHVVTSKARSARRSPTATSSVRAVALVCASATPSFASSPARVSPTPRARAGSFFRLGTSRGRRKLPRTTAGEWSGRSEEVIQRRRAPPPERFVRACETAWCSRPQEWRPR
jgi:hypothetical protein